MGIAEGTIKNKNEKIKKANISLQFNNNDQVNQYIITIDQLIEPQMRPRIGFRNIYDPMESYKNIIRKKIKEEIERLNIDIVLSDDVYIKTEIKLFKEPPKTFSNNKKYNALIDNIKFNKKPDIDNCVKTIYDSLEGILFKNDSQIIEEKTSKIYSIHESTIVIFNIYKQKEIKGSLNKNTIQELDDVNIRNYLLKEN